MLYEIKAAVIDRIIEAMDQRGYSKTDLAHSLNWSPSKITKIFSKTQNLSMDDFLGIAGVLGLNPALLLNVDDLDDPGRHYTLEEIFSLAKEANQNYAIFFKYLREELPKTLKNVLELPENVMTVFCRIRPKGLDSQHIGAVMPGTAPRIIIQDMSQGSLYGQDLSVGYWLKEDMTGMYLAINYNADTQKNTNDIESIKDIDNSARSFRRLMHAKIRNDKRPVLSECDNSQISRFHAGMVLFKYYSFEELPSNDVLEKELAEYYATYKKMLSISVATFKRVFNVEAAVNANRMASKNLNTKVDDVEIGVVQTRVSRCAYNALAHLDYKCEIDETHETFTSRRNDKPYMIASHLIPISAQDDFKVSLRVEANVCCLCPTCDAKLMHASDVERQQMLAHLYMKHRAKLEEAGINISLLDLFKYHGMS